jgi:hypothetical protein
MMGAACRLVRRAVSSLSVWILPIVVAGLTAAALNGRLSFHRGSGLNPDHDQAVIQGEQPLSVIDLYYSAGYVEVVKRAHQQGSDILASIRTLEAAWNAASPAMPLTIRLVSSAPLEPGAENRASPILRATAAIDETSFDELRPILEDIRNLILEGDGSGYGRLRRSGYQAQPAEAGKNLWAGSRDTKAGFIHVGPQKAVTHPVVTF